MVRPGIKLQQLAARLEHTGKLGMDRKPENAQHPIKRAWLHGQVGVAAHNPGGQPVLFRCRQDRPLGDIQPKQRQGLAATGRSGQLTQVVTLAATGIEATGNSPGWQTRQYRPAYRSGNRLVMAGIEEALAGSDHQLAVARIARALVLNRKQVGIALTGDVKAMTSGAAPHRPVAVKRGAVQGAGKRLE
jgi:hypothetical protein